MAKNNIKATGKWVTVADEQVRHIWVCNDEDCKEKAINNEIPVGPGFYTEAGTPICCECGNDMEYVRTEVNV